MHVIQLCYVHAKVKPAVRAGAAWPHSGLSLRRITSIVYLSLLTVTFVPRETRLRLPYFPLNWGARRSMKAVIPSF